MIETTPNAAVVIIALLYWVGLVVATGLLLRDRLRRRRGSRLGCPHMRIGGIYGDRINSTSGFARLECRDCGELLDGPVSYAGDYTKGDRR